MFKFKQAFCKLNIPYPRGVLKVNLINIQVNSSLQINGQRIINFNHKLIVLIYFSLKTYQGTEYMIFFNYL